jgi:hypothetical protein
MQQRGPVPTYTPPSPTGTMDWGKATGASSAPPPAPSDDPAQNPQAKATQSGLDFIKQRQQAETDWQGRKPTAPNYEDYKPPLWKKIVSPFIGAAAGLGGGGYEAGAKAGQAFKYGPWDRAQTAYGQQESQWKTEGEDLGRGNALASDYARVMQEGATNQINAKKEAETEKQNKSIDDLRQQIADTAKIKESDQKDAALAKISNDLESKSRGLDLKQMSIEQQGRMQDMANQIREQKNENDRQKFSIGTDAKSLEDERKARLTSIENDWKEHPYWNKLTGNKNKEIQTVNDEVNQRLTSVRSASGAAPSAGAPSSGKGVSLAAARQLPQYKGKSDAEIKQAIQSFGHQVTP